MSHLRVSICAAVLAVVPPAPVWALPEPSPSVASPLADVSQRLHSTVDTRGSNVEPLLEGLRQRGVWVVRSLHWHKLVLPASLRYRTVKVSELIEAVAAYRGLAVSWWQGRDVIAVLHRPTEASYLQTLLADLASTDERRRREAAWRAGWERDARLIPALVELAARGTGQESSRLARRTLARYGWEAPLALRETETLRLLDREFDPARFHIERVGVALAKVGNPEALGLVRRLADAGDWSALPALGRMRTEPALALLEAILEKHERDKPIESVLALELSGDPRALHILREKLLRFWPDKRETFAALGRMWGEDSLGFLKDELAKGDRVGAIVALGQVGGQEAFALLDRTVRDIRVEQHEDAAPALVAVQNLGRLASRDPAFRDRALATLELALGKHAWVYEETLLEWVIQALVEIGPDALPLLKKTIRTKSFIHRSGGYMPVESATVRALGELGGPGAWEMILRVGDKPELARAYLAALALTGREASDQVLALLRSDVRVNLEDVMGLYESHQAVRILNAFAEFNPDYYAREIRKTIVDLGGRIDEDILRAMATDPDQYVRERVPPLLVGMRGKSVPDLVVELAAPLASDPYWPIRGAAAGLLARLPEDRAFPLLARLANDEHANVRESANRELALLGGAEARRVLEATVPNCIPRDEASLATAILLMDMGNAAGLFQQVYLRGNSGLQWAVHEAARGWQSAKAQMLFPEVVKLMGKSLDDPDPAIVSRAVHFLSHRLSDPLSREMLNPLFLSPSYLRAKLGRQALASMGEESGVDFLKQLWPVLQQKDRQMLISVVRWQDDQLAPMLELALGIDPGKLLQAVGNSDIALARTLLAQGANVNARREADGRTILMEAASRGSLDMVRLLVENQASIGNKEKHTHMTALAYAVKRGSRDVAAYLLQRGADANAVVRMRGEPACSLLTLSLRRDDQRMARLLLHHGARREQQ